MTEVEKSIMEKIDRHRMANGTLDFKAIISELTEAERDFALLEGTQAILSGEIEAE